MKKRNPLKTARQSKPYSLMLAQRGIPVTLVGADLQPETADCTVDCLDLRTGQRLAVSESQAYVALYNSFCPLAGRPMPVVVRELLAEGVVLANTKGYFWMQSCWLKRKAAAHRKAA
ncbi:MAG TPA: hypothetical protein VF723_11405 [Pyrinomonadaceae bacterium]|jgi:heme O synthase-like polyprenyltransferase